MASLARALAAPSLASRPSAGAGRWQNNSRQAIAGRGGRRATAAVAPPPWLPPTGPVSSPIKRKNVVASSFASGNPAGGGSEHAAGSMQVTPAASQLFGGAGGVGLPHLHNLSTEQLAAVTAPPKAIRVVAGPGSGKVRMGVQLAADCGGCLVAFSHAAFIPWLLLCLARSLHLLAATVPTVHLQTRVLVARVAHLIRQHGVPPEQLLAITFTNKEGKGKGGKGALQSLSIPAFAHRRLSTQAAGEMRERLEDLLGDNLASGMWCGTFHRCPRLHAKEAPQCCTPEWFSTVHTPKLLDNLAAMRCLPCSCGRSMLKMHMNDLPGAGRTKGFAPSTTRFDCLLSMALLKAAKLSLKLACIYVACLPRCMFSC